MSETMKKDLKIVFRNSNFEEDIVKVISKNIAYNLAENCEIVKFEYSKEKESEI